MTRETSIGTHPSLGWPGRLSLLPLGVLLLLLPLVRSSSTLFVRANGQRLLVTSLELAFIALALLEPSLQLPRSRGRGTLARPLQRPEAAVGWLFIIWLVASSLSTALSDHFAPALVRQGEWLTHALFVFAVHGILTHRSRLALQLMLLIPIGSALYAVYFAMFAMSVDDPAAYVWVVGIPGFGNVRQTGYQLAVVALLLAPFFAYAKPASRRELLYLVSFTASWVAIFWGGSRGAFLSSIVVLTIFVGLGAFPSRRRFLVCLATCMFMAGVITLTLPINNHQLGLAHATGTLIETSREASRNHPESPGEPGDAISKAQPESAETTHKPASTKLLLLRSSTRMELLETGLADAWRHPLLGSGGDRFSFLPANALQPHNQVVQVLTDWGWLGGASFLMLLLNLAGLCWHRLALPEAAPTRALRVSALSGFTVSVVYSTVDGNLYFASPTMLAAFCLAVALLPVPSKTRETESSQGVAPIAAAKPAAMIACLLLAGIVAVNFIVTRIVSQPVPPPVGSVAEALLHHLPVRVEALNSPQSVLDWADDLALEDPERAIAWLHFGHQHARWPWRYYLTEADLQWHRGDRDEALAHAQSGVARATDLREVLRSLAMIKFMKESLQTPNLLQPDAKRMRR